MNHTISETIQKDADEDGNLIRMSRYERLMTEIIQHGVKSKVLLLSATPVNTGLSDLRNQLYF